MLIYQTKFQVQRVSEVLFSDNKIPLFSKNKSLIKTWII